MQQDVYRAHANEYVDVCDWDVVLLGGRIAVIGSGGGCTWRGTHYGCKCADNPRISSPVVDVNGRILEDGQYDHDLTGEGRVLLGVSDGSEIRVDSGKTYRLKGERKEHETYSIGSIWTVYAKEEPVGLMGFLRSFLAGARRKV